MDERRGDKYQQWLQSLKAKVGLASSQSFNQSIYRVPRRGTQQQENDPYTPRIVSIGPLHHRKRDFLFNEEAKFKDMVRLLERTRDPDGALHECANAIKNIQADARRRYPADLELEELEMVEILLLDGCFILENFISCPLIYAEEISENMVEFILDLEHDLVLLENQIPFSFLETLFEKIYDRRKDEELSYHLTFYALLFFRSSLNLSKEAVGQILEEGPREWKISHILDMLHDIYCNTVHDDYRVTETAAATRVVSEEEESTIQVPTDHQVEETAVAIEVASDEEESPIQVPADHQVEETAAAIEIASEEEESSIQVPADHQIEETATAIRGASEKKERGQVQKQEGFQQTARGLHLAGIQLVEGDAGQSLGMYFDSGNGTLRIPCLHIDRRTFVIFKNLIAYEQLSGITSVPVSSYAVLLNSLIKTSHDVKLLKQRGIIVQAPGETLDVLSFVRDLASEVTFKYSSFQLAPLCERVNKHMRHLKFTRSLRLKAGIWWTRSKDYWDQSVSVLKIDYLGNFWTVLSVVAAAILLILTILQTIYTVLGYYHQYSSSSSSRHVSVLHLFNFIFK